MARIHPTAIVEDGAHLADGVVVGPFCCVGADVVLDEGVELISHAVVQGRTRIGEKTRVFPFASIGHQPQDLKYHGEPSRLEIGSHNTIREHVTINPGTEGGGMLTKVGNGCLLMVGVHVGHDCQVGNNVIMANNATLAGHVSIGDQAVLGGLCAVHQFVRIGKHVMIGGMTGVEADVIPYGSAMGNRAWLAGLNLVGVKRRGFSREDIHALRHAYQELFGTEGTMMERVAKVAERYVGNVPVMEIVDFIQDQSSRSFCQPRTDDCAV